MDVGNASKRGFFAPSFNRNIDSLSDDLTFPIGETSNTR
jgi:hypothetical protein